MTMRATWVLVPLLLTLGCTGAEDASQERTQVPSPSRATGGQATDGPDANATPDSGTIQGVVTMYGGPAGATFPVHSGTLHVVGTGTDMTHALADDGTFEVSVPTGRFEVYANVPAYNDGAKCSPPQGKGVILVRRGEVSEVKIVCHLR